MGLWWGLNEWMQANGWAGATRWASWAGDMSRCWGGAPAPWPSSSLLLPFPLLPLRPPLHFPPSSSLLLLSARPSVSGFSACTHHVQFCICKVGSPGTMFIVWNSHLFYLFRALKRSCRSPRGMVKWKFQFTLAVWSWTNYLSSLSLSFPNSKMGWWHLSHRFAVRSKVDHLSAGAWHITDSPFILPRGLTPALQNTQGCKYSWCFISVDFTSSESTNRGSKYSGKKKSRKFQNQNLKLPWAGNKLYSIDCIYNYLYGTCCCCC